MSEISLFSSLFKAVILKLILLSKLLFLESGKKSTTKILLVIKTMYKKKKLEQEVEYTILMWLEYLIFPMRRYMPI